jgi:hypothetical protein
MCGRSRGKSVLDAHRYSYEIHHCPIPEGLIVRHTCDNPGCVNPAHLLLGTQLDNIRDRVARGRTRTNHVRKLDASQIAEVRRLAAEGVFQRTIADQYGVSQRTVCKIVNGIGTYKNR